MADNSALLAAFLNQSSGGSGSSDLDIFSRDLAGADYYGMAAQPILGAKFDTSTWSPGETAAVSAGQAFLGALLSRYGQQQQAKQLSAVAQVLPQIYANPGSVEIPEGVPEGAYARLNANAAKSKYLNELKNTQTITDLMTKANFAGIEERNKEIGKITGQNIAYGTEGGINPESPQAKKLKEAMAEEDARRKEIMGSNFATSLVANLGALPTLEKLASDDTGTSDIPFVFKFIQGLDGGVVKEGEVQMVQGANPLLKQFEGHLNAALNKKSRLGTELKMQMVNEMKAVGKAQFDALKGMSEPILSLAESRGASRKNVFPFNEEYVSKILTPGVIQAGNGDLRAQAQALLAERQKAKAIAAGVIPPNG